MVPKKDVCNHFMPFLIEYEYRIKDYKKANPTETREKQKANLTFLPFVSCN